MRYKFDLYLTRWTSSRKRGWYSHKFDSAFYSLWAV